MVTILKRSVISTVKIEGEFQNVSLLPLVFVVGDDGWKHSCSITREHVVLPSYNAQVEQRKERKPKHRKGPFRIDEDIRTMVQITTERESMDNDNNFTDEEKLRNQIDQTDSIETNLLQNHQICQNLAVVDDTYNFLAIDKLPFIEVDGQQMSSWIDVKELLFPKCSEPNCCEVLNCLMKKFLNPSNLNLMHPCSEKEQKLFLRQFKLVFQGCMLVSLPEVKKRLDILQAEVELNHLEKTGKEACSYLQTTCSKCSPRRPKTSLPRQRNLSEKRPKSADKVNSNKRHLGWLYDRLALVPILLVPEKIREPKQYGRSSQGPEADKDDIHFPVLLHNGQEKITVPCSIIARVFPQSYNVLLHCLLTTTNSQRQQEQYIFSACSSHQALSFNRWISKFLKDSNVRGVTTGSLLINLEKFSELTYDLLPLSIRRILQSKCRWPDLAEEGFKNIIIWDNRPCTLLKNICDSTDNGKTDTTNLISDFNYNAGTVTPKTNNDVVRDQNNQSHNERGEENMINRIECVKYKVYDPCDNKPYLPARTRRKGMLRVRPVTISQPTADHNGDANSSLSVSASQISSKKSFRVKSGRKISKSGLAKSPYLSQPAVVKNGAFFSKRLQIEKSKFGGFRSRSQVTDNIRKPDIWPKGFIASPPSVLRVKSPTKDIKVSTPRKRKESPRSEENVIQCAQINTVVDTSCVVPYNPILTAIPSINEKRKNKSYPSKMHGKRNDSVTDNCDFQSNIDSSITTAVLIAKGINLQATTQPQLCSSKHLQEDFCIITDINSLTIPSSDVESKMTEETLETREVVSTLIEKDHESPDKTSGVFAPVPSWQQLDLQLDPKHPYDDLHKIFQLPSSSAGKSSTNVPEDNISLSSSSVYTTSGSNSVACGILERDKRYTLTVDTSSNTLSPTNSSSVYSSDETNIPILETPSQIKILSESPPLKVDGLIEALETIQATAPKSTIENILTGHDKYVEEEKTVIDLASEVMKSNVIQNQEVLPSRPVSTALEMLLDTKILQGDSGDEVTVANSKSSDICVCVPSDTTCDQPIERNSNRQYIQIVNNTCKFKDPEPPKSTYTRQTVSKSPYKGSALKLNNESATTQTLQNALRNSKVLNNSRSLLTPDLLNISRFHSLGNVLVTNSTNDIIAPEKSAKMNIKDEYGAALHSVAKVFQEKRVEHIKINSSIPLRPQSNDQIHKPETNQLPTRLDGKDESVPSLDLAKLTKEVSRRSVRVQYDVKPSKSFGTGHFLHNKNVSTKMKKGMHVRHTMPIAKNQFNSNLKKSSPKVFQEIVTNKSSFSKPSLQNYFSSIPSENDYHIPPSSPNVTYRSQDSGVSNSDCLSAQFQSCPGCKNEINISNVKHINNVSEPEQCDSSVPCNSGRVIRQRYEDGRISVISVHDSINNQVRLQDGYHRNNCSLKPKRNQASIPLENVNRLEDNLSIMSLCSSREQHLYNNKRKSTKSDDRKMESVHYTTKHNISKDKLPVAREMVNPITSSNVVNVIFQYGPKYARTTNDGSTVPKSRYDNAAILAKTPDKRLSHFKRNTHQKLRICIDLVGSSDENSPLGIKKLV
ncbi:hypothetical protein LOTGIDRAFT_230664 [Lottia gigantea]|uniref:Uncharacterized protein n=1 Tax=Lottia gigantea TaxID=225164 RepID=V4CH12_LOTGI|nr:hypothetical protein LOTGIDRAFT_230664 [Lottia gigantea]ESP01370.1 hypothetical protein LOTGIDRAFT_230664 [Lottia gigantea]